MSEGEVVTESGEGQAAPATEQAAPAATVRWSDSFAPDIRDNAVTQRLESPEAAVKELIGAQALIGRDKVPLLTEESTPEERDAFFNKLGRPGTAGEYDFSEVSIPEGLPIEDGFQDAFVGEAHGLGLSQQQMSGILNIYYKMVGEQQTRGLGDIQRTFDDGVAGLHTEFGNSYDGQIDLAKRAMLAASGGDTSVVDSLIMSDGRKMGDHPAVIKMFAVLGNKMTEAGLVGGQASRTTKTPQEAGNSINSLHADKDFMEAYYSKGHPEHEQAVLKMKDLFETQG